MDGASLRFLHVSDLHILAEEGRLQHGADTGEVLRRAVPLWNRLRPDCIIASGDLIGDESEGAYRRLRALLEPVEAPIHFLLGNHDEHSAFRRVFRPAEPASAEPVCESFERGGVRFVLVDSVVPGQEAGSLSPGHLAWLEAELRRHPDRPTWIFLHHQPLPIYIRWLDRIGLENSGAFLTVLAAHPQVAAVGYGHVHQARRWRHHGALFLGAPALSVQFSALHQELAVGPDPPGFRRVEIAGGETREWLHFLDGRVVPEPCRAATPIYVRPGRAST